MEKIKVIIADDEKRIRTSLIHVLKLHYPDAMVVAEAENIIEAAQAIATHAPDVVLLDIKMPGGTGMELLKQLMPVKFKVIFITAFNNYAIEAIKYSALDYLLKPVIPNELVKALDKVKEKLNEERENIKLKALLNNLTNDDKKIVLNTHERSYVIEVSKIIRCEADRNYTRFFVTDKKTILVSGSLKEYESVLNSTKFFRPHHSHLINTAYISSFEKKDGGVLIMKDGSEVPVSIRKHSELTEVLKKI